MLRTIMRTSSFFVHIYFSHIRKKCGKSHAVWLIVICPILCIESHTFVMLLMICEPQTYVSTGILCVRSTYSRHGNVANVGLFTTIKAIRVYQNPIPPPKAKTVSYAASKRVILYPIRPCNDTVLIMNSPQLKQLHINMICLTPPPPQNVAGSYLNFCFWRTRDFLSTTRKMCFAVNQFHHKSEFIATLHHTDDFWDFQSCKNLWHIFFSRVSFSKREWM